MLKWISRTFSIATAISIALLIGAWPLRADLLDGAMVGGAQYSAAECPDRESYAVRQFGLHFVVMYAMVGGHTLTVPPATNFFERISIQDL